LKEGKRKTVLVGREAQSLGAKEKARLVTEALPCINRVSPSVPKLPQKDQLSSQEREKKRDPPRTSCWGEFDEKR